MTELDLPFRQIHLDFHTSEAIEDVGADFDPQAFAATAAAAHVSSLTVFGRCHHGWLYYDSAVHPRRVHPHLARRDLLPAQIDALHARGIRAPVYTTVQWDNYTSSRRPDWCVIDASGALPGTPPVEAGFYRYLCVNSPYRDFLKEHLRDLLTALPVDGLFLDITQCVPCVCRHCIDGMLAAGFDPADAADRQAYAVRMMRSWKLETTEFIRQHNAECGIFYNAGHVGLRDRDDLSKAAYTHWELESLPSGGWGYMHYPISVRYARKLGLPHLGMTAKFHTSWGDFHSYKNLPALEFEAFGMLANGGRCSVGDQLHPRGVLDGPTYELVGKVYERVEKLEPWCRGAAPLADIAVLTPEEFAGKGAHELRSAVGVTRMLQEGKHQFDFVDSSMELSGYKVVILPDEIPVGPELAAKLAGYLDAGGAVIASCLSGLAPDAAEALKGILETRYRDDAGGRSLVSGEAGEAAGRFALEALGVTLLGEAPYNPDFLVPEGEISAGLPEAEHVMYLRALEVSAGPDAEVLAHAAAPYFNRTWRHYCSHRHAPSTGDKCYPAVVRSGRAIYFAHPVFSQYAQCAPLWCKRLVLNALDLLLAEPLVRTNAPSTAIVTVNEQPAEGRLVAHLLHYVPERRGMDFDIIEDVLPLHDVRVSIRADRPVKAVRLAPEGSDLVFEQSAGRVSFSLEKLEGYAVVELTFLST